MKLVEHAATSEPLQRVIFAFHKSGGYPERVLSCLIVGCIDYPTKMPIWIMADCCQMQMHQLRLLWVTMR